MWKEHSGPIEAWSSLGATRQAQWLGHHPLKEAGDLGRTQTMPDLIGHVKVVLSCVASVTGSNRRQLIPQGSSTCTAGPLCREGTFLQNSPQEDKLELQKRTCNFSLFWLVQQMFVVKKSMEKGKKYHPKYYHQHNWNHTVCSTQCFFSI